jgi:transcription antitermination factor NusG
MSGPRWYAVAAKHRQEQAAAIAIQALGFPFFLPMIPVAMPNGGTDLRPMFGKYLFVEFDVARDAWGNITRLPCVPDRPILYLSDPCRPTPVPVRMLDAVRREIGRQAAKLRDAVQDPVAALVAIGASVRLVGGAAGGKVGTVSDRRRHHGMVEAKVEIDGCVLPLWVPTNRLALLADVA